MASAATARRNADPAGFAYDAVPDIAAERVAQFTNYLERDFKDNDDIRNIKAMLQRNEKRLIVDLDDLRAYDIQLAHNLLTNPMDYFPAFDKALRDIALATGEAPMGRLLEDIVYYVGLKGSFGEHHVNPRTVNASSLGSVIALEGIVTRCSLVRPKMVKSVHYCEKTQIFHTREYRDSTTLGEAIPTGSTYPTQDESGNPLTTEFGFSTFRDHQMVSIQEMPERAPAGQLPRSLDIVMEDDLVDSCKPGDRVQIVGVYRSVGSGGSAASGGVSGTFRTLILCRAIRQLDKEVSAPTLSENDVLLIRRLAQQRASYVTDLLAQSLAPSIYGHPFIKKALLLLLLGGTEHNLENGTHIRGDINMLLLGDPSTAKSQFLRFALKIAPLAIATTGRGSSGVGLTAAVTQDKETGDRRLEAGAMVLADRGIVCIDEFDKMNDGDRVAIHEVMEQQTITIAKAGIHTSLNARCSVLAAANPTYGQYDENLEPHRNIRLPDSLLSRFDLLFVILDKTDEATDRRLSSHVLQMHRYLPPGVEAGRPIPETSVADAWLHEVEDDAVNAPAAQTKLGTGGAATRLGGVSNNNNNSSSSSNNIPVTVLTGSNSAVFAKAGRRRREDVLTIQFLKKYIHYAKSRVKPVLTEEASQVIVEAYAALRNEKSLEDGARRTLPVTARTLETLIRLATAHAKARLSTHVQETDAQAANELLRFALFKEFIKKKKKKTGDSGNLKKKSKKATDDLGHERKKRKTGDSQEHSGLSDSEEDSEEDSDEESDTPEHDEQGPLTRRRAQQQKVSNSGDITIVQPESSANTGGSLESGTMVVVTPADMGEFARRLHIVYQEVSDVKLDNAADLVNRAAGESVRIFSAAEVLFCLNSLEKAHKVFIDHDSGTVYRI